MNETRTFTDALITAFLEMRGFTVRTKPLDNGRIAFEVSGERMEDAINAFYENERVPVAAFCSAFRNIRSMLFNAKSNVK